MAGSLWISKNGKRRKGTTFKDLQMLFDSQVTTKHIYESLSCASPTDSAQEIQSEMNTLDFDILGVVDRENVIGFVMKNQLKEGVVAEYINKFDLTLVTTDSTPIYRLIQILEKRAFAFVMHGNAIDGIVTIADINKPIVRLYIFGILSLFEMHLNYWLKHHFQNSSWKSLLAENRIQAAEKNHEERKKLNQALTLEECLQLCDKREILKESDIFLEEFQCSESKFMRLLKDAEKIRNELAHNQETIFAGLAMDSFVSTIVDVESFLKDSEPKVEAEEKARNA